MSRRSVQLEHLAPFVTVRAVALLVTDYLGFDVDGACSRVVETGGVYPQFMSFGHDGLHVMVGNKSCSEIVFEDKLIVCDKTFLTVYGDKEKKRALLKKQHKVKCLNARTMTANAQFICVSGDVKTVIFRADTLAPYVVLSVYGPKPMALSGKNLFMVEEDEIWTYDLKHKKWRSDLPYSVDGICITEQEIFAATDKCTVDVFTHNGELLRSWPVEDGVRPFSICAGDKSIFVGSWADKIVVEYM